jgi:hypothetical protein
MYNRCLIGEIYPIFNKMEFADKDFNVLFLSDLGVKFRFFGVFLSESVKFRKEKKNGIHN